MVTFSAGIAMVRGELDSLVPDTIGDSAQMNVWLHKTVLQKLAENGGNVPKELLDQF